MVLVSVLIQNKQIHVKQLAIFISSGVFGLFNSSLLVQVKTTLAMTLVMFLLFVANTAVFILFEQSDTSVTILSIRNVSKLKKKKQICSITFMWFWSEYVKEFSVHAVVNTLSTLASYFS